LPTQRGEVARNESRPGEKNIHGVKRQGHRREFTQFFMLKGAPPGKKSRGENPPAKHAQEKTLEDASAQKKNKQKIAQKKILAQKKRKNKLWSREKETKRVPYKKKTRLNTGEKQKSKKIGVLGTPPPP